jgi:isoleucyl-tRNA synthetase
MEKDKKCYNIISGNIDIHQIEKQVSEFWKENNIFKQSVDIRESKSSNRDLEYVFYDGPPFANGLPHYGHLLTGFIKDIFARYQTMNGKKVERRFGWDTHGLPVEMESEKNLNVSGRKNITDFGVEKFNKNCRESVMKYSEQWQEYVKKQGRWVDFDNDYKTMDLSYMESVIWSFKQLYDKGLIYKEMKVMPYSWKCETPLSNFETRIDDAYREKESKAVTLKFKINSDLTKLNLPKHKSCYAVVWTTTAWTLPSNLALAVGNEVDYDIIHYKENLYVIASALTNKYTKEFSENDKITICKTLKGKDLIGIEYQPVFNYFKVLDYDFRNCYKIYHADFVNIEDGTGIVHIAPAFGEDDQLLSKEHNIPVICPVDEAGNFDKIVTDYTGRNIFDCNVEIIKSLKEKDLWIKTEQYLHNYPHCWRSDTPLIYKAVPSWYVKVTEFKDRMCQLNQQINWIPSHIKDGLFGKWLANARDWSISRNRFWGCPVPVWLSDDPNYPRIDVYGSLDELEKDFGVRPKDLHRPYIDELVRDNPDDPTGKSKMRRVTDVLDCWFESGSMPYAQKHYPFENKEEFEQQFPSDFIVEYVAQTRGWFYTLMVLSTALFDKPPFLNCICHGVILDDKSQKLSKRLKNYTSPIEMFKKYGADSMRWFMASSSVMRGNELNIDKEGKLIAETVRVSLLPIWNSLHFFILYANIDNYNASEINKPKNTLDKYILSKLANLIADVKECYDVYDTVSICEKINGFVEILNNWYIRRNRDRFWTSGLNEDKKDAFDVLYTVILNLTKISAPLLPHLSEYIYQILIKDQSKSVHLQLYPNHKEFSIDQALVEEMDLVQEICSAGHSLRNTKKIRIRQPLASLTLYSQISEIIKKYTSIIEDELNIKKVNFKNKLPNDSIFALVLNFKLLGKRFGSKVPKLLKAAKEGDWQKLKNNKIEILSEILEEDEYTLKISDKLSQNSALLINNEALLELDFEMTDSLKLEGIARDLIRFIQQDRKESSFEVSDYIHVDFSIKSEIIIQAVEEFKELISLQVLAKKIKINEGAAEVFAHDCGDDKIFISLKKDKVNE